MDLVLYGQRRLPLGYTKEEGGAHGRAPVADGLHLVAAVIPQQLADEVVVGGGGAHTGLMLLNTLQSACS